MADFGLYTALSGRKDWAQVRQDRLLESQFLRQQQADLQARIAQEAKAREGVTAYMEQINQASVLEQDLERVKGVEAEQRKKIVAALQKAGNNYQKFLMGDGASLLNGYYEGVMKSEEMQNAVNNKLVNAQSHLDAYLGRKPAPVTVTLPDGTQKEVGMEEQYKMFDNGEITKLNYAGSVKPLNPVDIFNQIQSTYGKDRYKKQAAKDEDIFNYAKAMGAPDWEAKQIVEQYKQAITSGAEPVYFKQDQYPSSNKTGSGDYKPDFLLQTDELIRQIQQGVTASATALVGSAVGDDRVVSYAYRDNDKGQKNLVLTLDRVDSEKMYDTYNSKGDFIGTKTQAEIERYNKKETDPKKQIDINKSQESDLTPTKNVKKEMWINLTDPGSYNTILNQLNTVNGRDKISIEELDVSNKKHEALGIKLAPAGTTTKQKITW